MSRDENLRHNPLGKPMSEVLSPSGLETRFPLSAAKTNHTTSVNDKHKRDARERERETERGTRDTIGTTRTHAKKQSQEAEAGSRRGRQEKKYARHERPYEIKSHDRGDAREGRCSRVKVREVTLVSTASRSRRSLKAAEDHGGCRGLRPPTKSVCMTLGVARGHAGKLAR